MSLELPFGIKVLNPTSVDAKYLNDTVPYTATTQVNTIIGSGIRHIGLTVNINNVEYWYENGITDPDLVIKSGGGSAISGITDIENIGVGEGIYSSPLVSTISGETAQLRTLVGSGNTTVSTSGDTIIISSSGGTGTGKEVIITTAANVLIPDTSINTLYVASGLTTGYTLAASPTIGAEITISDGLGTANTINIGVNGNGKNILNDTTALINTDYGSFTILYNGVFWSVTSSVP